MTFAGNTRLVNARFVLGALRASAKKVVLMPPSFKKPPRREKLPGTKSRENKPRKEEPLTTPPEKPTFRRGIKLGRVRRVYEARSQRVFRYNVTTRKREPVPGESRMVRRTVGYEDSKTHKKLSESEIARFRSHKRSGLFARLLKQPEGSPLRAKKFPLPVRTTHSGKKIREFEFRDKFTGKPLNSEQTGNAIQQGLLSGSKGAAFPKHLDQAAHTISKNYKITLADAQKQIRKWWIRYESAKARGLPRSQRPEFPYDKLGYPG